MQKVARSTLWQLSSQAVAMALGILSIKLVTNALSQELVGNYQTVYAYLQIFGILADFGLYAIAVRELSRVKNRAVTLGSLFVLRSCITVLSLSAAVLIAWIIPVFRGTPLPIGITIAMFVPFFTLLAGMLRTLFQVEYQMRYVFFSEIFGKAVPVLLIALTVLLGARQSENLSLYYAFLAFGGVGSLTLFLLSVWFARRLLTVHPRFTQVEFLRLARLAAPFGLAFLMTTIYRQSDVTLIALLRPDDYGIQNAYYGVVMRLAEIGFLLPTFVLNSALPIMSTAQRDGVNISRLLGQVLLALLTIGSIVSLFSFFWARPLVLLLTQESYLSTEISPGSDTALQLLSFSMFLSMIISFCFYLLLHNNWWKRLLAVTCAAALFSVLCNLFLIPLLGFVGAGITSIMTHLLLAFLLVCFSLRSIEVSLRFSQFARWFVFTLLLAAILSYTAPLLQTSLLTIVAGIIGLAVSIFLLKILGLLPRTLFSFIEKNG